MCRWRSRSRCSTSRPARARYARNLIVAFLDHRTGLEADFAIQILASGDPHYLEMKQAERAQLLEVHPTLTVRADLVGTDRFQSHLEAMIEDA